MNNMREEIDKIILETIKKVKFIATDKYMVLLHGEKGLYFIFDLESNLYSISLDTLEIINSKLNTNLNLGHDLKTKVFEKYNMNA